MVRLGEAFENTFNCVFLVFWMELCNFVAMTTKKTDKESAIKSILSDLKKGIDKPTILSKYVNKCQKDERTVRRWHDEANTQYLKFKSKADPIIEAKEIEALGEVAKAGILSKIERQKILTDIALGNLKVTKPMMFMGEIIQAEVIPSHADIKNAIAELNKMDGDYAPTKIDQTTLITQTPIFGDNPFDSKE